MGASSRMEDENRVGRSHSAQPSAVGNRTGARVALLRSPVLQPAPISSLPERLAVKGWRPPSVKLSLAPACEESPDFRPDNSWKMEKNEVYATLLRPNKWWHLIR
jgi:hypothetical protein